MICPAVISQYAALGALQEGADYPRQHLQEIAKVREVVLKQLQAIDDICTIAPADGAFYFFLKVNTNLDDLQLVKQLIEKYRVAVIPGSTFGLTDGCYLRIAYGSLQLSTAKTAVERLINGLKDICANS